MPILSRVSQGVSRGIRAIRQADPTATVLLVDNVEHYKTRFAELADEVERRNLRRFIVMDLITGRVDKRHPLYEWLTDYGVSEIDLEWFRTNPQTPDVMGLDYYPHSDWQIDMVNGGVRQRRADNPVGLYGIATEYFARYGLPMIMTETSIEGAKINREIWFETMVEQARKLRSEGIPLLGLFWWPMVDNVDWDGALTHRVGKIHQVGLYNLERTSDGTLQRVASPLVKIFKETVARGEGAVGTLDRVVTPAGDVEAQDEPLKRTVEEMKVGGGTNGHANGNGHSNGNGNGLKSVVRKADPVAGAGAEASVGGTGLVDSQAFIDSAVEEAKGTDRYGIVVFSHLRWGFVWQRPQQFLSRFARRHRVLFVEEPMFDVAEGGEARVEYHRVMPNVVVACPHVPGSWNRNPNLPGKLREFTRQAIKEMNDDGSFDRPLMWYYSPMDSAWSLGHFENRGVVYDCMDELSQFTGAPRALVMNEARLMEYADVVFTGGYNLGAKKKQQHDNVHIFGCGVEFEHFSQAQNPNTAIPPDVDFIARPILGFFGVVDERVDYGLLGEVARLRPDWSIAMVGPVVKVDPNLLPHSPNLFWLGGRDYQVLPNYVKAFDICMMPFALNAATEFINPTKGLEYMATGRPIVSTHVKDVVRQWSDICHLTKNDPIEFVKVVDRILTEPDPERVRRGVELAKNNSWENTVKTMQGLIKEAITKQERRSTRKIIPVTDPEQEVMAYQYQPTQGS
jgi:glycosyltransferase involved in cell wall biosynthesis